MPGESIAMNADEQWLPVVGYECAYEVSDYGQVRSCDRTIHYRDGRVRRYSGCVLKPVFGRNGRRQVCLRRRCANDHQYVYRLVLTAFVGQCPPGMECCHEDGDRTNDRLSNLRWDTHTSNVLDTIKHGNNFNQNKTCCPLNHRLALPNLVVHAWAKGNRTCLACARARSNEQKAQAKGTANFDFRAAADVHYEKIMITTPRTYRATKQRWHLTITPAQSTAVNDMLKTCT